VFDVIFCVTMWKSLQRIIYGVLHMDIYIHCIFIDDIWVLVINTNNKTTAFHSRFSGLNIKYV